VNQQGYVCMQLCDPDPDNPRLTCPADTACYLSAGGTYADTVGPIRLGRCGSL
jgi:hypothetical protein